MLVSKDEACVFGGEPGTAGKEDGSSGTYGDGIGMSWWMASTSGVLRKRSRLRRCVGFGGDNAFDGGSS